MKCPQVEKSENLYPNLLMTKRIYRLLKDFSSAQQALASDLREAKPLGICKITISGDLAMEKGVVLAKSGIIHIEGSKEMST